MLSLKDYSRTFRGITTKSVKEDISKCSKSTWLVRYEKIITFIGKFYFLHNSRGTRLLNHTKQYGVTLNKLRNCITSMIVNQTTLNFN
jgi:hypothetical protein